MTAPQPALLIFAKAPVPGAVKTRLAEAIGPERAARVYTDLVATTLAHAHAAWRSRIVSRLELWCMPDAESPFLRGIAAAFGAPRRVQVGADLGERMAHALADALQSAPSVLLIGTDCPLLDPTRIAQAAAALDTHDAVLGPAEDGGYVLLGARRPVPLAGVRWSTPHALSDTVEGFRRADIRFATLPVSWDVDDPAGLARFDALRNPPLSA